MYRVHIGFFGTSLPCECFVNCEKQNSTLDIFASDSAILLSLLLQYGVPIAEINHSLKRDPNGEASSLIGAVCDLPLQEIE
jgi:hypothetical protein